MKKLAAIVGLLALTSCVGVSESYSAANESIYEAIAPEYKEYVEADERLPRSLKDAKLRTLDRWKEMLDKFAREAAK